MTDINQGVKNVSFEDSPLHTIRFQVARASPSPLTVEIQEAEQILHADRQTNNGLTMLMRQLNRTPNKSTRLADHSEVPTYGDDWAKIMHERTSGFVDFVLQEENSDELIISQFHPSEHQIVRGNKKTSVYNKKKCKYKMNATPEQAGFVLPVAKQLDQWRATALCGNDITSSVIYTAGLVAATAGYYTPICLLLVVLILYLFRGIYEELVSALPLNGGTYTGILNTSRKGLAVTAACLSFLSYVATAVVSAASAMDYLSGFWPNLNTMVGTIVVICAFACLMLIGIKESAMVASVIFAIHLTTLAVLIGCALAFAFSTKWEILRDHYTSHGPEDPVRAIVLGFANSMLGISGFESSANFVEHQAPGVFPKTLRNMWLIVAFVNPIVSLLGFAVVPPQSFYKGNNTLDVSEETEKSLLALMGKEMTDFLGGVPWLEDLVIADAILVLCGAVLTGYVGVMGLLNRMVDDDIFPHAFLARLPVTGANFPIVLFFCGVCVTLILVTLGDIRSISGVYTVAFLSVMFLFCLSTLILKHTRRDLKRNSKAKWYIILLCMGSLIIALVGNCVIQPIIVGYTALYFSVFMCLFYGMYTRSYVIRAFLQITKQKRGQYLCLRKLHKYLVKLLIKMENVPVIFFSRRMNLRELNQAVQIVLRDELSRRLTVVHIYESLHEIPDSLHHSLRLLDTYMYPNIRIDVLLIKGTFGPGAVRLVETLLDVPPNRMFIVSPSQQFRYTVAELGSVRIIMSRKVRATLRQPIGFLPGSLSSSNMRCLSTASFLAGGGVLHPVDLERCGDTTAEDRNSDANAFEMDEVGILKSKPSASLTDHYVTIRGIADFKRYMV